MAEADFVRLPDDWTPDSSSLKQRVVLIVGATGGLGRASALAAARAGASVVLLGRKVSALEAIYDEIVAQEQTTPAIYPLNLEGATPRDYENLVETIERECGRLDGIVHAAAHFAGLQPAEQIRPEEWIRALHVNVSAPFLLTQACLPLLRQAADSSVVFVLDDNALVGKAYWGGYGTANHALRGLISVLHHEWDSGPLRIHALLPAPMRTQLRRTAYFGENSLDLPLPDAAGNAVAYLLSAAAVSTRGQVLDLRDSVTS